LILLNEINGIVSEICRFCFSKPPSLPFVFGGFARCNQCMDGKTMADSGGTTAYMKVSESWK